MTVILPNAIRFDGIIIIIIIIVIVVLGVGILRRDGNDGDQGPRSSAGMIRRWISRIRILRRNHRSRRVVVRR